VAESRGAYAEVTISAAPGWWPSLVDVSCTGCGWSERVNLNDAPMGYADRLAARHECADSEVRRG
jgi:RNase P subunit RPR2